MTEYKRYSSYQLRVRGPDELKIYRLPIGITTIGRNPGSDLFLNDPLVSRDHAQIECRVPVGGGLEECTIADWGTTNGTLLNSQPLRIPKLAVPLRPDATIHLGSYTLTFQYYVESPRYPSLAKGESAEDEAVAARNRQAGVYPYRGEVPLGLSLYSRHLLHYLPEIYQPEASAVGAPKRDYLTDGRTAIYLVATHQKTGAEFFYSITPPGATFGLFGENGQQRLKSAPLDYPLQIVCDWGNVAITHQANQPPQTNQITPVLTAENGQPLTDQSLRTWLREQPLVYGEYELTWNYVPDADANSFLSRFLALFESVMLPIESMIHYFYLYLDPNSAPREFFPWLERWFRLPFIADLTEKEQQELLTKLSVQQRRQLLLKAHALFEQKGTKVGLAQLLQLFTEDPLTKQSFIRIDDIDDLETTGDHFVVKFTQRPPNISKEAIEALIEAFKPVHTTYDLEIP